MLSIGRAVRSTLQPPLQRNIAHAPRPEIAPTKAPLIVAHRGSSQRCRENTIDAYIRAAEDGADFGEADVQLTKDQQVVLWHDATAFGRKISSRTLHDLRAISQQQGIKVDTLADLLAFAKDNHFRLDIELKGSGYEKAVVDVVRASDISDDQVVYSSFRADALRELRALQPSVRRGLILDHICPIFGATYSMRRAERVGASFLAVNHSSYRLSLHLRALAARKKLPFWIWTVNDRQHIRALAQERDVEAIISDCPDVAKSEMHSLFPANPQATGLQASELLECTNDSASTLFATKQNAIC